jgi:hypothetical protein
VIGDLRRELYRARWRREREKLGIIDARQEKFASGGLGQYVPNLTVRSVILTADPDGEVIYFDQEFWSWWRTNREGPFGGPTNDWERVIATNTAAVRFHRDVNDLWKWDSYLALHRHGGLDMGLGRDGAGSTREGQRGFRLIRIVGLLWTARILYRLAVERFKVNGPWECSLALLGTLGAGLGNFATGWLQYPDPEANPYPCAEPNLWRRLELEEWPTQEATRDLAFSIGSWIENSWACNCNVLLHVQARLKVSSMCLVIGNFVRSRINASHGCY